MELCIIYNTITITYVFTSSKESHRQTYLSSNMHFENPVSSKNIKFNGELIEKTMCASFEEDRVLEL